MEREPVAISHRFRTGEKRNAKLTSADTFAAATETKPTRKIVCPKQIHVTGLSSSSKSAKKRLYSA